MRIKIYLAFILMLYFSVAVAQGISDVSHSYSIKGVRYWFDQSTESYEATYRSGTTTIDVSHLEVGFHTLHYQVVTTDGEVSIPRTCFFFRVSPTEEHFKDYSIQTLRYWFDQSADFKESSYRSGTTTIDVSHLEVGFHTLHYQVVTTDGEVSTPRTCFFFRVSPTEEHFKDYIVKSIRYWFDNNESTTITCDYSDGILQLDLSHLAEGQHTMTYQVVADDGSISPATTVSFYRNLYDVYVRTSEEYSQETIDNSTVLSNKPDLKLHYETNQTDIRGHLTTNDDATLSLGKFVQTTHLGNNSTANKYQRAGEEYYHLTTLVNNGFMRADSVIVKQDIYKDRWHFISLPFNVNVSDIRVPNGTYWALREYDGEQRASGNMTNTWNNLRAGDTMKAGHGYILQGTNENGNKSMEFVFASVNDTHKNAIFTTNDVEVKLNEHEAEFAHNRGWNFIGNPFPSFYDTRNINHSGTITVWNGNGYSAYSLQDDHYILMPFEAFFVQKPLNRDHIVFSKDGRQHTEVANNNLASKANLQRSNSNRIIYNIQLSNEEYTDKSRIVLNENATLDYETDKDAVKFMEQKPATPQLYSTEAGVNYAINERPVNDGIVNLSVYLPEDGTYSIHMDETDNDVWLIDTEKNIKTPLNREAYTFDGARGSNSGRFIIAFNDTPTSIENIADAGQGDVRVVDHTLSFNFINPCNVKLFGANGTLFYNKKAKCDHVKLNSGIYILDINGRSTKVAIK